MLAGTHGALAMAFDANVCLKRTIWRVFFVESRSKIDIG